MSNDNQHWVPKFLIKNFADSDGRVFCLNIQTDEIKKRPPRQAASTVGFNDFLIKGETLSFEDRLEKIETKSAPIFREIINARSTAGLTQDKKLHAANFIAAQSFRTEAFYKGIDGNLSREKFGRIFAELWRGAFIVSGAVERRPWIVMAIEQDEIFYLGDHPVVLQHTEKPSEVMELGFDIQGVEIFLPLTPKLALYMPCSSTAREITSGYESALRIHHENRSAALRGISATSAELALFRQAQKVLRTSFPLYEAIKKGTPITAAPENIENLNYLQCMWAHSAIYSNRKDFTFAKRVFREHPQYRNTLKVRIRAHESAPTIR